jgi:hypothetical protein
MRAVSLVGYAMLTPRRIEAEESGERHLEIAFSKSYGSFDWIGVVKDGERVQESKDKAGAYAVKITGEPSGKEEIVKKMIDDGDAEKVWEHTLGIFDSVDSMGKV